MVRGGSGRFVSSGQPRPYQVFMSEHECVRESIDREDQISERDKRDGWVTRKLPISINIGHCSELRIRLARNPWHSKAVVETIVKDYLSDLTFTWD